MIHKIIDTLIVVKAIHEMTLRLANYVYRHFFGRILSKSSKLSVQKEPQVPAKSLVLEPLKCWINEQSGGYALDHSVIRVGQPEKCEDVPWQTF